MRQWIEMASVGIELLAVAVIVGSVTFGSLRFLLDLSRRSADPYSVYKDLIGRSLLLGLEFLVAADVIRTVALELTPRNIGMLGALVVIRTFLSWSVVVETEGHWPWQPGPRGRSIADQQNAQQQLRINRRPTSLAAAVFQLLSHKLEADVLVDQPQQMSFRNLIFQAEVIEQRF